MAREGGKIQAVSIRLRRLAPADGSPLRTTFARDRRARPDASLSIPTANGLLVIERTARPPARAPVARRHCDAAHDPRHSASDPAHPG